MATILITGANRGIGLALARILLEQGESVIALARQVSAGLSELTENYSGALDILSCDVNHAEDLEQQASKLRTSHRSIDVIVNNAAIMPEKGDESLLSLDLKLVNRAFATNVVGPINVIRAFFPLLEKSEKPRIMNLSSGLGSIAERDDFGYYPYSISKAALNMLTRSMAYEFTSKGFVTVAISPGWVRTSMGGEEAPLSVEESASSLAEAIRSIGHEHNGMFLDRHGKVGTYAW
jgi:NAD(P)-dependent dehydrogenase (short-subunit alcohol dehydrogenase family)